MAARLHPRDVLHRGGRRFPALPACDHYAGTEKLMRKSLALQASLGPIFDLTLDCEDGAPAGREREHACLVAELLTSEHNAHSRVGARVHDVRHAHWREDVDIIVGAAGNTVAYLTLPKVRGLADVVEMAGAVKQSAAAHGIERAIPLHVLIETPTALREAFEIASLAEVESIDFGLMDFVSAHHGAIPASAMRSPGQFTHPLVVRAKTEVAAAALAAGVVPAHNVTTELRDTQVVYQDARRAREEFGFLRMWSIHPDQIEPIVRAMRPDASEADRAAAILAAAQDADWGPIRHEGELHDRASYRFFWELLERAHATGTVLPQDALERFFTD